MKKLLMILGFLICTSDGWCQLTQDSSPSVELIVLNFYGSPVYLDNFAVGGANSYFPVGESRVTIARVSNWTFTCGSNSTYTATVDMTDPATLPLDSSRAVAVISRDPNTGNPSVVLEKRWTALQFFWAGWGVGLGCMALGLTLRFVRSLKRHGMDL